MVASCTAGGYIERLNLLLKGRCSVHARDGIPGMGQLCTLLLNKNIEIRPGFKPGSSERWSDALTNWSRR